MSLAVKYRPKTLDEIIGQKMTIKSIKNAFARKIVPHTWCFLGPSGCGKTSISRILANEFSNGKAGPSNIVEIDAATNSGAEDMRNVTNRSYYKALGKSPIKTIIVDEVHRLSGTAFDSLLKSIEEPPEHVFWCLCSTNESKIPNTIKTRCVTYHLKPVDEVLIYELLLKVVEAEKLNTNEGVLEAISESSNGSPRQALTYLELGADAKSVLEIKELMKSAIQTKGMVDLAKLLLNKTNKPQWPDITRLVTNSTMENDAEGVRIGIVNYVGGALMKAKSNNEARRILSVLECFSSQYNNTEKLAPLLLSIGLALGLDAGD